MELCNNGHDEICYSSDIRCPMCERMNTIANLESKIDNLEKENTDLKEKRVPINQPTIKYNFKR
ncbi:MAG: hypothetical protein NUV76_12350 [Candidatus Kuenenia sp.]|nr:hypothetical protein [Candidatus Kuenenia sp.]